MSEQDKFENEEKDEVEAHKRHKLANEDPKAEDESSDDFEAHRKHKL